MTERDHLRDILSEAIAAGLRVHGIVREPDGRLQVLTGEAAPAVNAPQDELGEARKRRATKGNGHVDVNETPR